MENSSPNGTAKHGREDAKFRIIHLLVTGRVQGVYFRGWAKELAEALKLEGWVRNRRDGSVEMLISGGAEAIGRMLKSCGEGPPDAHVTKVEIIGEGGAAPGGFAILPTA